MKLNFWQWLGLILLAVGLVLLVIKRSRPAGAGNSGTAPVVQPVR
jgi:hypothetical protein